MAEAHTHGEILAAFARVLEQRRSGFAADVLGHSNGSHWTVSAHLYVDAFVTSLLEAHEESNGQGIFDWASDSLAQANILRPPKDVARALGPALSHLAVRNGFGLVARPWIQTLVEIVDDAFAGAEQNSDGQLDEVDATINRLLSQLEGQDPLSAEHSRAVGSWCARIARCLHLDDSEAKEMSRAGRLHDIGKIDVPEAILAAPRALTESEWILMRAHSVRGDEIAQAQEGLHPYRSAIRHHHERLDGSGYPDGLRGDGISLQARIVAVADAFNAMIGRRPYREPLPPAQALAELDDHTRSHFDPEIVRALRTVLSS